MPGWDPEVARDPVLVPLSHSLGASGVIPAKLSLTVDSDMAPKLDSSPSSQGQ